jgi:hypothetical protein
MARTFWFVTGAGAGAYALTRARRVAESLTADGLRDRLSGIALGARMFREEVASGQAEKEAELRERLGLVPHGIPELTTSRHGSAPRADGDTDDPHPIPHPIPPAIHPEEDT